MQDIILAARIAERDMIKYDFAFFVCHTVFFCTVLNRQRCIQYFIDTLCRNGGSWQNHEDHYQHQE